MFGCVTSLVKTDPDCEVRKAAAMFATLLLQGLGQDTLKVSVTVPCTRMLMYLRLQTGEDWNPGHFQGRSFLHKFIGYVIFNFNVHGSNATLSFCMALSVLLTP